MLVVSGIGTDAEAAWAVRFATSRRLDGGASVARRMHIVRTAEIAVRTPAISATLARDDPSIFTVTNRKPSNRAIF
jgi:hypothetical protein